jgi:isopentenyldiphosphate isomerase
MSYIDRIEECNAHDPDHFRPLMVAGTRVGWIDRNFADILAAFDEVFHVNDAAVVLAPAFDTYAARSAAVAGVVGELMGRGIVTGWREESYPVGTGWHATALFEMERAAIPRFGIAAYGVHVNGFVRKDDGIHMWIARRARDKQTYPGELDNMVAGGQPVGIGLMENVIKEAGEEAAVPPDLARGAVAVGCISYRFEAEDGLRPDVMFNFDLELPGDFTPRNNDGEIAGFELMPVAGVMALVADTTEFKFNCNLVNIDFFVRHGLIPPDDPDYVAIVSGLHQ